MGVRRVKKFPSDFAKFLSDIFAFTLVVLIAFSAPAAAQDAVDLASCVQTPGGVDAWARTATITHLELSSAGFHIDFDKQASWPDVTPPGWDGPIRWTVWLGAQVDGRCHLAASLNVWNRSDSYGGPVDEAWHWPKDLWYLDRTLQGHTPAAGETVYLMVTAGAERGLSAFKVAERSQVVAVPFGAGSWSFTPSLPPAPPPTSTLPPQGGLPPTQGNQTSPPPAAPLPTVQLCDLTATLSSLERIEHKVDATMQNVSDGRAENRSFFTAVANNWKGIVKWATTIGLSGVIGAKVAH